MSGAEPAEDYIRIFLHRWDIQNVKTILRGKSFHIPQDEIFECLVPAGDLDDVTLGEMIRQPDVKSVIDLLATWRVPYAKPLTRHFREYAGERNLIVLESALDQYYYSNGLDAVKEEDYDQDAGPRHVEHGDRRGERQDRPAADPRQDRAVGCRQVT